MEGKAIKFVAGWFNDRFPSIVEMTRYHATDYPTPPNLNYSWVFGVLILVFLMLQIVTGIGVAMFYKPEALVAFDSIERFRRHVHWGWLVQSTHAVCPTFIFGAIYIHTARGIYYGSYKANREIVWWIGLFTYLALMMESFMGYVLPWGQMSYWAGTVITGLASVIPVFGDVLVTWVRGDIPLSDATLNRFFSLHIAFFPFVIISALIVFHILALHDVGSNNPTGVEPVKEKKIPFYPYYVVKDFYVVGLCMTVFLFVIFFYPNLFLETGNFIKANPALTPHEIKPEWYFLPFFAMLRAIPSKGIGVLVLWASMWILFFLPFIDRSKIKSGRYRPIKRLLDAVFFLNFIFLGYLGYYPPHGWLLGAARAGTFVYFGYFILLYFVSKRENKPAELIGLETAPEKIIMHGPGGTARFVPFLILIVVLAGLNLWAFNFKMLSPETVEEGRAVYLAKGKSFHDIKYVDESALMSAEMRKKIFGVVPPDLSLKHKSMAVETPKEFLSKFIGATPEGSKMTVVFTEQEVDALAVFLEYASDPSIYERARYGPWVILSMSIFTVFLYLLYKQVWAIKIRENEGG